MKKLILLLFISNLAYVLTCSDSKEDKQRNDNQTSVEKSVADSTDSLVRFYQNRIKRGPYAYLNYTKLGEAFIQKGRETGDIAYYNKADEALQKAVELNPDSYAAYVYLGQVSSFRHEFHKTLSYAKKAIELRPNEDSPYGILGDAYLELGVYDEAQKAYEKMLSLNPSFYSYSRISHIKELKGEIEGATQDMLSAIDTGIKQKLPKENIAWAYVITGSLYYNKGDSKEAENHYRKALNISNNYYLALEHLAEINAVKGNYDEAVKLYERVLAINPKPEFYIALGGVYENIGNHEKADDLFNKAGEIYAGYIDKGNYAHLRETALFYADNGINLDRALDLAKKDLEIKKDIYAYDTLAWVYYKQGKFDQALEAANESLKLGTKDAILFYHAGMIHYKLNSKQKAKEYLTLALSTNPYFDANAAVEIKGVLTEIANKT